MRTGRTGRATAATGAVLGAVLAALLLGGCGADGKPAAQRTEPIATADGSSPGTPSAPPAGTPSAPAPRDPTTPGPGPTATAPPSSPRATSPSTTLVRVTRSGGFAGRTGTLVIGEDGSWSRLDGRADEVGRGKLTAPQLGTLRAALREADFARLPRTSKSGTVFDGFTYAFAYGGFEVATGDGSVPMALTRVLDALPPFED
ncbi:hypothetical protein OS965_18925 [Streptomyces sp. H27-G5]|uniref:hypothetical protein n=1 Tax=Streptomyces sp. H27-G5 TaxID=2996698 RepID=UPI00226F747D|nr:hypothetical protein [Streptomyces sp. H27-G5]MCY0920226.1 hypothetical protein [Streptomyces sp. H27-G5]